MAQFYAAYLKLEASIKRICRDDVAAMDAIDRVTVHHGGDRKSETIKDNNIMLDSIKESTQGTSSQYALRKLRSDRPDLHTEVMAGKLSPHSRLPGNPFSFPKMMNIAENIKLPPGGNLDMFQAKALYLLASPFTPEPAREEALSLVESGEKIKWRNFARLSFLSSLLYLNEKPSREII